MADPSDLDDFDAPPDTVHKAKPRPIPYVVAHCPTCGYASVARTLPKALDAQADHAEYAVHERIQ